jgi:hypothetical protein
MTQLPLEFATKDNDYPLSAAVARNWQQEVAARAFTPPRLGERLRGASAILSGRAFEKAMTPGMGPRGAAAPLIAQATPAVPNLASRAMRAADYALWGDPKAFFPPGYPLPAQAPDAALGRKFDYPFYYNTQITPRSYESITFEMLRDVSRNSWDILRLVIETAKSQISSQPWDIVPTKDDLTSIPSGTQDRIKEITKFFRKPDMRRTFSKWMRMLLEDLFVLDAPCLFVERCVDGTPYALKPIDGGTIAPKLDYWGDTPQYPDVAYQQVLKGLPALDYTMQDLIRRPIARLATPPWSKS